MTQEIEAFRLQPFLETERRKADSALDRALEELLPLLPQTLREPISYGVLAGGKRLRPILCSAAFSACEPVTPVDSDGSDSAYDLAACLELIHAYSLMHDDLPCMDDAELRRGRPTPHTLYGEPATKGAGVALISLAGLQAWTSARRIGLDMERTRAVVQILCEAAGAYGMVGGQAIDLLGEGHALSRTELDELHHRKTGALLSAAARIGAVAAGAPAGVEEALGQYGKTIGLAFQIVDDVLDATADAETLGKKPSDRDLKKSTYVGALGIEGARREADRLIQEAVRVLRRVGVRSEPLEGLAWHMTQRDR